MEITAPLIFNAALDDFLLRLFSGVQNRSRNTGFMVRSGSQKKKKKKKSAVDLFIYFEFIFYFRIISSVITAEFGRTGVLFSVAIVI